MYTHLLRKQDGNRPKLLTEEILSVYDLIILKLDNICNLNLLNL
jgi:hypothetical protein